jgi:hypothetical protein
MLLTKCGYLNKLLSRRMLRMLSPVESSEAPDEFLLQVEAVGM